MSQNRFFQKLAEHKIAIQRRLFHQKQTDQAMLRILFTPITMNHTTARKVVES